MSDENDSTDAWGDDQTPSKSARKREAERLQNIGRRLGALNAEQLAALDLPGALLEALTDYRRFPSHGAKRRQLQYIGKLMRDIDSSAIEAQLADLDGESALARYRFSQLERWRDALINEPESLTRFINEYPEVDRQQLRQLLAKVKSASDETQQKTSARALFRFLRDTVETS